METLTLPGVAFHSAWNAQERLSTKLGVMTVRNTLVTTTAQLEAMASVLCASPRIVYDSETSGVNPHLGARIIGHAFAVRPAPDYVACWYVPIRHTNDHTIKQLPPEVAARAVQDIFSRDGECGMHNDKFEKWFLRKEGIRLLRRIVDTARLANAANENERSFALKNLADRYLIDGAKTEQKEVDDFMRRDAARLGIPFRDRRRDDDSDGEPTYLERFGHSRVPIMLEGRYACRDVLYTAMLLDFYAWTRRAFPELTAREESVSDALHDMEWYGLPLDTDEVRRAQHVASAEVEYYRAQVRRMLGCEFEINDNTLRDLFFNHLKMEPPKLTKSGERAQRDARDGGNDYRPDLKHCAVDKEVREILAAKYPQHRPLILALSGEARARKIATTYTSAFLRYYSPETGCLHPVYNQLEQREEGGVPVTGRLSSADPNIQNIAKKPVHLHTCGCKKCIQARAEGDIFDSGVSAGPEHSLSVRRYFPVRPGYVRAYIDFSQIELRILAWLSRDPTLLYCYANDLDVHKITSDEVTGGDRDVAKQVNFGNSYGMTEHGLAKRMKGYAKDPEGTKKRAKVYLDAFFKKYHGIQRFRDDLARQMLAHPEIMFVSPFGRPRRIVEIGAKEKWIRARGERMMMSSIVSGTAADLMKEVLIRAKMWLRAACPEALVIQTIHDEIVYEVPERHAAVLLHGIMQITTNWPMFERGGVPVRANCAITTTTWEAKREAILEPTSWRYA
jgi:DNA polymerase-1